MACDYRIAAENAKFNQAYVNIGLSPDCGSSYFLTRALGPVLAIDLIFTGRVVAAEEALRLGIVNQVVPQEEFAKPWNRWPLPLPMGRPRLMPL